MSWNFIGIFLEKSGRYVAYFASIMSYSKSLNENEQMKSFSDPDGRVHNGREKQSLTENSVATHYCLRVKNLDYPHSTVERVAKMLRRI